MIQYNIVWSSMISYHVSYSPVWHCIIQHYAVYYMIRSTSLPRHKVRICFVHSDWALGKPGLGKSGLFSVRWLFALLSSVCVFPRSATKRLGRAKRGAHSVTGCLRNSEEPQLKATQMHSIILRHPSAKYPFSFFRQSHIANCYCCYHDYNDCYLYVMPLFMFASMLCFVYHASAYSTMTQLLSLLERYQ